MIYFIFAFLFVILQGFFSGIETGLVSILKPRVQHAIGQKVHRAKILNFFLSHPGYMLGTTLIGTNCCIACASNMVKQGADDLGYTSPATMLLLTVIMSAVLLLLEIVPKDWFRQQPYQRCLIFAYLLYASYIILYIPVHVMAYFTGFLSRMRGKHTSDEDSARNLMREDFVLFLRDSESAGIIDSEAADILDRSLDFSSIKVSDIMQKRANVKEINTSFSIREAIEFSRENGKSRMPVSGLATGAEPVQWKGIFSIYDAMFTVPEELWHEKKVSEILRPIVSVGEDCLLDEVLAAAKKSRIPILAVRSKDESRHIGIVTPNDVIRQLFG